MSTPAVGRIIEKAAVSAASIGDTSWAGALADYRRVAAEFVEFSNPVTIIGRLRGLRPAPFNTRFLTNSTAFEATFIGEGAPIGISKVNLNQTTLPPYKLASLSIVTQELAKLATPSAEDSIKQLMRSGLVAGMDRNFIDPALAPIADVHPGSITYGAPSRPSTGSGAAAVSTDLTGMLQSLIDGGSNLRSASWVMHTISALYLSTLRDAGGRLFPNLEATGGMLLGVPVLTSSSVPRVGSPPTSIIALIDGERILLADDKVAAVSASIAGAVEMLDNPTNDSTTPTATSMVSLYQVNCAAIRVMRAIAWARMDSQAVQVLTGLTY